MKGNELIDEVDDGFNYFIGFRLEQVNSDDQHYISAFMDYICFLECKINKLSKKSRQ